MLGTIKAQEIQLSSQTVSNWEVSMGWAQDWIVGRPRHEAVTKPGHLYSLYTRTSCALFTPIHSCLLQEDVVPWFL